jgi:hypothetical protein
MSAVYDIADDDEARAAMMRAWGINRTKPAQVIPLDHSARRKPLGLRPIAEPLEPSAHGPGYATEYPSTLAGASAELRQAPTRMEEVFGALDAAVAVSIDGDNLLQAKLAEARSEIARLEVANAKLTASLAEVRSKLGELGFVQERLQLERRGAPGVAGPRGADGPPGMRGERGPRGEAGTPAPVVSAWEPHAERFTITPIYSTGERGPPINMLSLFQAYDSAVSDIEDRDLTEAAAASRARNEEEVEARHWAK